MKMKIIESLSQESTSFLKKWFILNDEFSLFSFKKITDKYGRPFLNAFSLKLIGSIGLVLNEEESKKDLNSFITLIDEFINLGYDLESKDKKGMTLLNLWCQSNLSFGISQNETPKIINLLLEKGADPNTKNINNKKPINYAIEINSHYIPILLKSGAVLRQSEVDFFNLLMEKRSLDDSEKKILNHYLEWKAEQDKQKLSQILPESVVQNARHLRL